MEGPEYLELTMRAGLMETGIMSAVRDRSGCAALIDLCSQPL